METENEPVDVESVDDIGPAATLLEGSSSDDTASWQRNGTQNPSGRMMIPKDLDPESRKLIKEMLEEERKYRLGRNVKGNAASSTKRDNNNKVSHMQRWTEKEKELFFEAMLKHGHRWKKISEIIGTRTPLQVKSFSRHVLKKKLANKVDDTGTTNNLQKGDVPLVGSFRESLSDVARGLSRSGVEVKIKSGTESDEEEEVDILNDSDDEGKPAASENSSRPQAIQDMMKKSQLDRSLKIELNDISKDYPAGEGKNVTPCQDEQLLREVSNSANGIVVSDMAGELPEGSTPKISDQSNDSESDDEQTSSKMGLGTVDTPKVVDSFCSRSEQCKRTVEMCTRHDMDIDCSTDSSDTSAKKTSGTAQSSPNNRSQLEMVSSQHCPESRNFSKKFLHPVAGQCNRSSVGIQCNKDKSTNINRLFSNRKCDNFYKDPADDGRRDARPVESCHQSKDDFSSEGDLPSSSDEDKNNQLKSVGGGGLPVIKGDDRVKSQTLSLDDVPGCSNATGDQARNWEMDSHLPGDYQVKLSQISEEEQKLNKEFFYVPIRHKNIDNYLKIRNFFVKLWETTKPAYVAKSMVRSVFKKYGDTHTVARIHGNLEKLGLINVGVENPYKRANLTRRQQQEETQIPVTGDEPVQRKCRRSRTKPSWKDLDDDYTPYQKKSKRVPKTSYDPFKLIECSQFTDVNPAPFSVSVEADALALMDLHAHLSSAEVIGLLGGWYEDTNNRLNIRVAKPCKSLSTGMQCEMDPVSQTVASEAIMSAGLHVVGWYHSHPTFLPNPSVRDIETQAEFQGWFGQDGAPFVGIIVSPYQRISKDSSLINCLMVRQEDTTTKDEKSQPYQFDFATCRDNISLTQLLHSAKEALQMDQNSPLKIVMDAVYTREQTYLEKTIASVCSHYQREEDKEVIRSGLSALLGVGETSPENDQKCEERSDDTDHDHG